jgi:hypothetical protein
MRYRKKLQTKTWNYKPVGPIPNVIAGIMIGVVIHSLIALTLISLCWAGVFCVYISVLDKEYVGSSIHSIKDRGQRLFFNSPRLTFYSVVYSTALVISLLFGIITYGLKFFVIRTLPNL